MVDAQLRKRPSRIANVLRIVLHHAANRRARDRIQKWVVPDSQTRESPSSIRQILRHELLHPAQGSSSNRIQLGSVAIHQLGERPRCISKADAPLHTWGCNQADHPRRQVAHDCRVLRTRCICELRGAMEGDECVQHAELAQVTVSNRYHLNDSPASEEFGVQLLVEKRARWEAVAFCCRSGPPPRTRCPCPHMPTSTRGKRLDQTMGFVTLIRKTSGA
mmetsp:Transcript_88036/g.284248  ORF Transcript_88036/g.284248 Transcript_88036/m.284248 type:complete len:219 (-) Transcript_88036:58-714(-)